MSWWEAVPIALLAAAWLLLPGLPAAYAIGLRGLAAWAIGPVIGVALVGVLGVLAAKLGIAWSPWLPVVAGLLLGAGLGVVAFLFRRRVPVVRPADPLPVTLAAAGGGLAGLVLGTVSIVRGFGRPDNLSQTYDALFHYNAVAMIVDTHNASALTLSNFDTPGTTPAFYPAAWHELVALLVSSSGTTIPVAANLISAVVAVLLWPLSCMLLARQIFGRSPGALVVTGALSVAFAGGTWGLLGFGVLWPNTLGLALMPAALAVLLSLTRLAKDDAIGRRRSMALLPVVLVSLVFAHPGALFGVVVLGLFPVGHALLRRVLRQHREGHTRRGVTELAAVVVVLGAVWYWTATTTYPLFQGTREIHWAPFETPSMAVGEVLLNATNGREALWLLSVVVVVGMVASLRTLEQRWLVPAWAATGFLFVVAAALNRPDTRKFTGYWYNDSYRLAAMLPVTAIPLATAGILFLAQWIARRAADRGPASVTRFTASATALAIALVALLTLATRGLYEQDRMERLAGAYLHVGPSNILATPEQRDFLIRIGKRIPEGSVVANNPWDGSGMLWVLADRRPLFPHFTAPASKDSAYLALHLDDVATDPEVCAAALRLKVDYLLINDGVFWGWDPRRAEYPGFADPQSRNGFQLVEAEGGRKLYRITACASSARTP